MKALESQYDFNSLFHYVILNLFIKVVLAGSQYTKTVFQMCCLSYCLLLFLTLIIVYFPAKYIVLLFFC